ncbi:hypothetical protein GF325_13790 [Candidatus Bathyarchaeota archaeon]|nr:hypothetical protein [Candidatus Bathyarchaeota archaeon]
MASIQSAIEELKESFQVEEIGKGKVKVYLYVSNDLNFELELDLRPIESGKKPKIGFEKEIKEIVGNINTNLDSLVTWGPDSSVAMVLYELEDKLIEASTAKFTVMDEIYVLVGNYGPRASFEGKIAKVKIADIRKNEYLITIDCTDYPSLKMEFPQKLAEKIGEPEDLRFVQKWGGHLFELVEELEYRLNLYERLNFEFQVLNKFSNFVVQEALSFNPVTGYISGDLEKDGTRIEIDLDYQTGYPEAPPRAIINIRPDNPSLQQKVDEILAKDAEEWAKNKIFILTLDKIVQAVFGERLYRDMKTNKPLTGSLYTDSVGGQFLQSSKDKEGEKFRSEFEFFGNIFRKKEKLIDDLLGKFEE